LANVKLIGDTRLAHPEADPDGTLALAVGDETVELHDQVCFAHAESLDWWDMVAYQHDSQVIRLVRLHGDAAKPATYDAPGR
jgi:hypothetical protein